MQCSCGGETMERSVVEKKQVVMKYLCCRACGRIHITQDMRPEESIRFDDNAPTTPVGKSVDMFH